MFQRIALFALILPGVAALPVRAETTLCTEISTIPTTISVQGVYCLKKDLNTSIASGNAITIATNNVTIDCNGRKLGGLSAGAGTRAHGISALDRANITVRDCNIRGFYRGIVLDATNVANSSGHLVEGNRLDGNTYLGMRIIGAASTIRGNVIVNTGGTDDPLGTYAGILVQSDGGLVADNTISGAFSTATAPNANILRGIFPAGKRMVVESNRITDLVTVPGRMVRGIFVINTDSPSQVLLQDNAVLMPPGTQGYGVHTFEPSSICRDNVFSGFDQSWLAIQGGSGASVMSSCTDGGGNSNL